MDDIHTASNRDLRKENKLNSDRQDILDIASKLFAAKGVSQTSMSDIADHSGFSVGKIYKFFPSKKSLFLHIVEAFLELMNKSSRDANDLSLPPLKRLNNVLQAAIDVAHSNPDHVLIHLRENPSLFAELKIHYQDIYVNTIQELLTEAMEAGHIKTNDPILLAIMLVGAVDALFSHLASSEDKNPFSPIPHLVFNQLISPLLTESSPAVKDKQQ